MGEEAGTEEEVQEAEEGGGARKRKRGVGAAAGEEVGDAEVDGAAGVYEKDLLGDGGAGYEGIAEEAVAEVMRWLEAEIIADAPAADEGFVTINGNEESCGPSFSAASSTVMASVDTRAGAPPPPPVPWPWPVIVPSPGADDMGVVDAAGKQQTDVEMGGGEADEEWLARLLTCGGPLLEGVL